MSDTKKFTLDDIRKAAEKKYADTPIDFGTGTVTLVNAMRLPKLKRDELLATQKTVNSAKESDEADDIDQAELLEKCLRIVANGDEAIEDFIDILDHDLTLLAETFALYTRSTDLGEASASAS